MVVCDNSELEPSYIARFFCPTSTMPIKCSTLYRKYSEQRGENQSPRKFTPTHPLFATTTPLVCLNSCFKHAGLLLLRPRPNRPRSHGRRRRKDQRRLRAFPSQQARRGCPVPERPGDEVGRTDEKATGPRQGMWRANQTQIAPSSNAKLNQKKAKRARGNCP